MAFNFLESVSASAVSVTSGVTTPTIADSTGAALIAVVAASFEGSPMAIQDNKGNTYTLLGYNAGNQGFGQVNIAIGFVVNPITGVAHTFENPNGNGSVIAASTWYITGGGTPAHDQTSVGGNNGAASTTYGMGSLTPGFNNALIIAAMGTFGTDSPPFSIDGGFTLAENRDGVSGTAFGLGLGYLIQTSAAPSNPAITIPTGSNYAWGLQASFYVTGGGGGNSWYYRQQEQAALQQSRVTRTWDRLGSLWQPSFASHGVLA